MRIYLIILLVFIGFNSSAQLFYNRTNGLTTPNDPFLSATKALYIPRLADTSLMGGLDTLGAIIYVKTTASFYIRDTILTGVGHKWTKIFKSGDILPDSTIDVFLLVGQSNIVGFGSSGTSPVTKSGTVFQFYNEVISAGNDPIGNANTGSAWPQFGIVYNALTARKICFVPSAVSGTSQTVAANTGQGTWDTTGVLFDSSVARLNRGMAKLVAAGYKPVFRGILWGQGETDANAINSATITQSDYLAAFQKMIGRYRTTFGQRTPFYIFRTGTINGGSDIGYDSVRQAQQTTVNGDSLTTMVFYNARYYLTRGLMPDTYHYTQPGYNEMGRIGAINVVAGTGPGFQTQSGNLYTDVSNTGFGTGTPTGRVHAIGTTTVPSGLFSGGNVGINISSPTMPLHVNDSARVNNLTISRRGLSSAPSIFTTTYLTLLNTSNLVINQGIGIGVPEHRLTGSASGVEITASGVINGFNFNATTAGSRQPLYIVTSGLSMPTAQRAGPIILRPGTAYANGGILTQYGNDSIIFQPAGTGLTYNQGKLFSTDTVTVTTMGTGDSSDRAASTAFVKRFGSGLASTTASNGLIKSGNDIQLGDSLTHNTTIDSRAYSLTLSGTKSTGGLLTINNAGTGKGIVANSTSDNAIEGIAANGTGVTGSSTGGVGVFGQSENNVAGVFYVLPGTGNTETTALQLTSAPTVSATDGTAVRADWYNKNASGSVVRSHRLVSILSDATGGLETSQFVFRGLNSGTEDDLFTINGNGYVTLNRYPFLTPSSDFTANRPIGYNLSTGDIVPMNSWDSGGSSGITGLTVGRVVIPGSATTVTDNAGLLYDTTTNKLTSEVSDATTNTAVYPFMISHKTSGVNANGSGVGMEFRNENAAGINVITGSVTNVITDATNASEDADINFNLIRAGTMAEVVNIKSTGALQIQTDNDADGAVLDLYRNDVTPIAGDRLGEFHFYGRNSSSAKTQFAAIYGESPVITAGTEAGRLLANITVGGVIVESFRTEASGANTVTTLSTSGRFDGSSKAVSLGDISVTPTYFKYQNSANAGMDASFYNSNTGTGVYADLQIAAGSASGGASALRLMKFGNAWGSVGAYRQSGVAIEAGSSLTGGMSFLTQEATGRFSWYTGGFLDANERMRLNSAGELNIANFTDQGAFTIQNTGGLRQNGSVQFHAVPVGTNSMNILLQGSTDSTLYKIPASTFVTLVQLNDSLNNNTIIFDNPNLGDTLIVPINDSTIRIKSLIVNNGLTPAITDSTITIQLGGTLNKNTTINGIEVYDYNYVNVDTFGVLALSDIILDGNIRQAKTLTESISVSAAGTVSMTNAINYIASGTTATYTLPTGSAILVGRVFKVKSRASGNTTIDVADASSTIYDTSAVASIVIAAGGYREFIYDGTFWLVK